MTPEQKAAIEDASKRLAEKKKAQQQAQKEARARLAAKHKENLPKAQQIGKTPLSEKIFSFIEPAANLAAQLPSMIGGGIAGAASLPWGVDTAVENMGAVSDAMTYQPVLPESQQNMATLRRYGQNTLASLQSTLPGQGITHLARGYNAATDKVGAVSPTAGAMMKTAPVAAELLIGGGMTRAMRPNVRLLEDGQATPQLEALTNKQGFAVQNITPETKALVPTQVEPGLIQSAQSKANQLGKDLQVKQIESGGRDGGLAPYQIENGRRASDKFAVNAVNNGWDQGTVQMVKTSNPQTRSYMNEMLSKRWAIKNDKSGSRANLPMTVVGKSMNERIKFLFQKVKKENARLENIKRTKLNGVQVDGLPVQNALFDVFDRLKIQFVQGDDLIPYPIFDESVFKLKGQGQTAIRNIVQLMTTKKSIPDAADYHLLKLQLDDLIDYSKLPESGMTAKTQQALQGVRSKVNEVIGDAVPEYADANKKVSTILRTMDEFNDAAKVKFHLLDDTDASLGQEMRVLQTNYARGPLVDQAAAKVDQLANDLGGNFKSNYADLVTFANDLDARFGSSKTGDFQGKNQAAQRAERFATDAATGNKVGQIREGLSMAGEKINKMRGKDPDFEAYKALREVLGR